MSTQDLRNRRSTLLQRYQPGAGSQDPLQHQQDSAPIARSTSQRSLQNSSLLQKYYPKTTSQDLRTGPPTQSETAPSQATRSSSQRSIDKSKLLQRYSKQNSLDSQDVPKPEPQRYSSQKSLEGSKLLQRYNVANNSQEFTGLAPRESTPVARFQRSGSLDHDKMTRSSLLSKYTPRFGKSLDRNKPPPTSSYSNYSSQQSLDQQDSSRSISASQTISDYGGDHFDQYDAGNLRSRSSSLAKGLNRKSLQRDLPPPVRNQEIQKVNASLEPVTAETLPVVAASVPIMGNIASALPMPMLTAVTPAPILEVSAPTQEPLSETTHPPIPMPSVVSQPPPETPKRKEPVKPPRKDLATTAAVPYDSYEQEEEHEVEFYGRDRKYGSEQPEIRTEREDHFMDEESVGNGFTLTGTAVPPTPPRRRKKRFRDVTPSELTPFGNGLTSKPIYNSFTLGPETHVFNADVPLAQEESFTTPIPTPRRSRSRSQLSKFMDDDRTSRGAESYIFGAEDNALVKLAIDMSESNGYATVRKEPPPRPPAPIRRRKSTRSLGDQRQFNTLPNFHSVSPARPSHNYSTISPSRPPRGRSISSLNESATKLPSISKDDITQYEDIEAVEDQVKLHETLQSGEVVKKMKDRPLPPPPRPPRDTRKPRKFDNDDRLDFDGGAERITTFDTIEPRVIEEVEIAIQTDPVSEDFELDIEVSETIGKSSKTLQEILKEEQQAEIDRARQLAEASNLMRDIQKFRDSTSSLSLHGSRPETPSAMTFERRVSAPSTSQMMPSLSSENLTEQDLANIDDDKFIAELVKKYVSEEKVTDNAKKSHKTSEESKATVERIESEKMREIESMIVQESVQRDDVRTVQSRPSAPPRRRSLVSSTQDIPTSIEIPQNVIEEIVERIRTNEQQHIAELEQLHQQQLEDLRKQHDEQRLLQEQKLEEQQKILLEQQHQQLHETQQLKEQILQQQEHQMVLLQQQQQQQQQLLLAQQQQQILLQQQEKERELQREKERELLREREIELEKARERERELHHARELELQRARELEQQRARELEQQRLRELELQRTMELEHQRLRELEQQRAQEAELQRVREAELQRARDAELQRARETEIQRIRETEMLRAQETELLKLKEMERKMREIPIGENTVNEAEPSEAAVEEKTEVSDSVTLALEVGESIHETAASEDKPAVESTAIRPPPPRITPQIHAQFPYQEYLPYSLPPQPFYTTRNLSDDESAYPQVPHRRRRHHRSRRESTSEEEIQREPRKQRHGTRSPEPSIPALGGQLIRACGTSIRETGDEIMTILRASSKDENKRDLHIALIILIVIVAGLMALGMSGEQNVHHHHWDYFNPPGNSGR